LCRRRRAECAVRLLPVRPDQAVSGKRHAPGTWQSRRPSGYSASAYAVASQPRSSSSRSVAAVMRTR
jgi:hypothetical protein